VTYPAGRKDHLLHSLFFVVLGRRPRALCMLGKSSKLAGCWWFMPIILATQEQRSEDQGSKSAWANSSQDLIWKRPITKKGLVEWFKM
jgi:hypothetical protein